MKPIVSFLKQPSSFHHTLSDFDNMYDEVLHMDTALPIEDRLLQVITSHPSRCLQLALVTYFGLLLSLHLLLSSSVSMKDNWLMKKLYTYACLSAVGIALIDIVANFQMPERLSDVLASLSSLEETNKTTNDDEKEETKEPVHESTAVLDIPTPPAAESSPAADVEQVRMQYFKQLMGDLQSAVSDKSSLLIFFAIVSWMVLSSKDSRALWSITSMTLAPHLICALGLWLSLGYPTTASSMLNSFGILASTENSSEEKDVKSSSRWSVNRATLLTLNSLTQISSFFAEISILIPTALTLLRSPSKGKSLLKQMLDLLLLQNYLWARFINVYSLLPSLSSTFSGQLQQPDSIATTVLSRGQKVWNTLKEKATYLLSGSGIQATKPVKGKKKKAAMKKKKQRKAATGSQMKDKEVPTTSIDQREEADIPSKNDDSGQEAKGKEVDDQEEVESSDPSSED